MLCATCIMHSSGYPTSSHRLSPHRSSTVRCGYHMLENMSDEDRSFKRVYEECPRRRRSRRPLRVRPPLLVVSLLPSREISSGWPFLSRIVQCIKDWKKVAGAPDQHNVTVDGTPIPRPFLGDSLYLLGTRLTTAYEDESVYATEISVQNLPRIR